MLDAYIPELAQLWLVIGYRSDTKLSVYISQDAVLKFIVVLACHLLSKNRNI